MNNDQDYNIIVDNFSIAMCMIKGVDFKKLYVDYVIMFYDCGGSYNVTLWTFDL